MKNRLLIVFAKSPDDPTCKTRMKQDYEAAWVERLYELFIENLKYKFKSTEQFDVCWGLATSSTHSCFLDCQTFLQKGSGLGQRLKAAWNQYQELYEEIIVIGSDAPQVTLETVSSAFDSLSDNEAVMGLAEDGGFYLFGSTRKFDPNTFLDVSYSQSNTGQQLAVKISSLFHLAPNFDVDDKVGLKQLIDYYKDKRSNHWEEIIYQMIKEDDLSPNQLLV